MTQTIQNFDIPDDLCHKGKRAAEIIRDFCAEHELGSGQRVFISPAEWRDRGERYGNQSLLVVMHEGTDANRCLSMDGAFGQNGGDYSLHEALVEKLADAGVYLEQMFGWSSAVYEV